MAGQNQEALWRWQHAPREKSSLSLEAVEFSEIPGWLDDDHCAALACYARSAVIADPPLPVPQSSSLKTLLSSREAARIFFEENFVPQRVKAEAGLLTSYFEPVLKGSRTRSPAFPVPVYRRPADLEALAAGHALLTIGLTAGRAISGQLVPYFTRSEIEAGALDGRGLEILYLADPIHAFIMHVQGSGRVELDDGTTVRLSFDGKNGHPYTSISKILIKRGHLAWEDAHLDGMVSSLRATAQSDVLLAENKSYIFFKELDASETAPRGSMGTELSAGRSLAADPLYHDPGIPIWVAAPELFYEGAPFRRLVVAQDTGSAIKGAQRGDIFVGQGAEAGRIAGRIRHKCEFIVLRPRR
jgi:membrane-bound lytic murein transglycosylase A